MAGNNPGQSELDFPWRPHGTREHGVRRGIIGKPLILRVPFEVAAESERDIPEVGNGNGSMRDLRRRYGGLAGKHRIDEIPPVIVALVKVRLSGTELLRHQRLRIRVEGPPVDPNPPV